VPKLPHWLSRLFNEPSGETLTRSGDADIRGGEAIADIWLGDPDEEGVERPTGEPAPVEADEAAWQHEREQREHDGRQA
jgi:hypothetical protein